MMEFWNIMKGAGMSGAYQLGQNRWGTVTSVKQTDSGYEAKITLQPEGVMSGWLPVLSPMVGGGWGLVSPPYPGMQAFVASDTGDGHHGVILGLSYSLAALPPVPPNNFDQTKGTAVQAGEMALVSQAGAVIRLCTDGSIHIKGNVRIDGNVTIQGDVAVQASSGSGAKGDVSVADKITATSNISSTNGDVSDQHGTIEAFRQVYNPHVHGTSSPPTPQVPD